MACADDHPQRPRFLLEVNGGKTALSTMGKNTNAQLTKEAEASTSGDSPVRRAKSMAPAIFT